MLVWVMFFLGSNQAINKQRLPHLPNVDDGCCYRQTCTGEAEMGILRLHGTIVMHQVEQHPWWIGFCLENWWLLKKIANRIYAHQTSGMEYKGTLKSIDQYMNLQILNTEDVILNTCSWGETPTFSAAKLCFFSCTDVKICINLRHFWGSFAKNSIIWPSWSKCSIFDPDFDHDFPTHYYSTWDIPRT